MIFGWFSNPVEGKDSSEHHKTDALRLVVTFSITTTSKTAITLPLLLRWNRLWTPCRGPAWSSSVLLQGGGGGGGGVNTINAAQLTRGSSAHAPSRPCPGLARHCWLTVSAGNDDIWETVHKVASAGWLMWKPLFQSQHEIESNPLDLFFLLLK